MKQKEEWLNILINKLKKTGKLNKDKEIIKELKQEKKKFDEWENSVEGILYNLQTLGDATKYDDKDKLLITKTLLKLPKKIRKKVLREVTFVIMQALGTIMKVRFSDVIKEKNIKKIGNNIRVAFERVFIFLNFPLIRKRKKSEFSMMSAVAHEIAHFILGHHGLTSDQKAERKADNLIEKWGFKRVYKTYKHFEK